MIYAADSTVRQIAALAALTVDQRNQALADAARVFAYIKRHPWISRDELADYGERNNLKPDALNCALAILSETGRVHALNDNTFIP